MNQNPINQDIECPCYTCDIADKCEQLKQDCQGFRLWTKHGKYKNNDLKRNIKKIR